MVIDIPVAIYKSRVYVCFGEIEEILEWFRRHKYKLGEETRRALTLVGQVGDGGTLSLANGNIIIRLRNFRGLSNVPELAHEADHAATYILRSINCSLDVGSTEPHAYLVEFLVREILDGVRKMKRASRKSRRK